MIEVRRHDVGRDQPPAETFDLVHARLVLVHVTDRDKALRSMIDVLRPGGWLLLEDADPALQPLICPDEYGPEQRLANRLRTRLPQDARAARRGPQLRAQAAAGCCVTPGLIDVEADAFFPMTSPACDLLEAATVNQIRDGLIAGGYATAEEIDRHLANVATGNLDLATSPMVSAWGRRP